MVSLLPCETKDQTEITNVRCWFCKERLQMRIMNSGNRGINDKASTPMVCFCLPRDLSHTSILYHYYNYFPTLYQYRIHVVQHHYT